MTYLNINQFTEADAFVKENIEKYGKENVTFVGHSLGGGLAEYYAVQYDADAITFASADVYDLLSDEQKKNVKNGVYRDKIISYTYPDDIVGSWYDEAIGSTYYMSDPYENNRKTLSTHGIDKNFNDKSLFNKNGYYLPEMFMAN
ncbi:alpha/beta fold hydrolase [Tigheibacillus jepli]|uniref:alpha/beta fold hydrolase n=1 Tax=Tigheibacillus jepli TaxID=3035914 RepID=UPI00387E0916